MIKQLIAASAFSAGMLLAGAAMAQAPNPGAYQRPGDREGTPAWHQRGETAGDMYTHALNTLYAHGFHAVRHLSLQDGAVHAMAVTPNGRLRPVAVVPGTDRIEAG